MVRLPLPFVVAAFFALICSFFVLSAKAAPVIAGQLPVRLHARDIQFNEQLQMVSATGDVEVEQGLNLLRAERMTYSLDTDTVEAEGNVSLLDEQGNVHFAERVELTGDMKDGAIKGFLSLLSDGSRFTAAEAKRENGTRTTMKNVSYTPCNVCEDNPQPVWQIKADEVVHDETAKSVSYKNARFEFWGVPMFYTPIFSHADPSVKRKSGFLRPSGGWTNELGTHVQGGYYFGDIAPDKDATVFVRPTTRAGTLFQGQWRQRFTDARLQIDASTAQSDRKRSSGFVVEDKWRGHVTANGIVDINNNWRAGMNVSRASDKGYLRLYDISNEDVLESDLFAERFSGRDYSRLRALTFQDLRIGSRPQQPDVLPMFEHRMVGAPDSVLGGRFDLQASLLGVQRNGEAQSVQRASFGGGWERRNTLDSGILTTWRAEAFGDAFAVQESLAAQTNPALDSSPNSFRGTAALAFNASYPLAKRLQKSQIVIEPIVGAILSPHIDENDTDTPNEDSIDIQLDTNNLFEINRFPGRDKREDGARINYGVKTGIYADSGRRAKLTLGQSYRFDDDNVFPKGSGLDRRSSDLVGQVNIALSKYLATDYRFQLDSASLSVRRHELQARGGNDIVGLKVGYLYIDGVSGTGLIEPREQVQTDLNFKLSKQWWLSSSILQDFGDEPGLRRGLVGINYADECFSFALEGARNLIREESGESGTVLMLRLGLRNLGEFATPKIKFGATSQNDGR